MEAKKWKKGVVTTVVAILLILVASFLIRSKTKPMQEHVQSPSGPVRVRPPAQYELTQVDLFAMRNFTADDVSVKGVQLGDTLDDVIGLVGYPDKQTKFENNVVNWEYSTHIGLNESGLILHLENDKVTRITVKKPFNKYLMGETQVNHTKAEIYHLFGVPDQVKHVRVSQKSAMVLPLLEYSDKGLQVVLHKDDELGFSLTFPGTIE